MKLLPLLLLLCCSVCFSDVSDLAAKLPDETANIALFSVDFGAKRPTKFTIFPGSYWVDNELHKPVDFRSETGDNVFSK